MSRSYESSHAEIMSLVGPVTMILQLPSFSDASSIEPEIYLFEEVF